MTKSLVLYLALAAAVAGSVPTLCAELAVEPPAYADKAARDFAAKLKLVRRRNVREVGRGSGSTQDWRASTLLRSAGTPAAIR